MTDRPDLGDEGSDDIDDATERSPRRRSTAVPVGSSDPAVPVDADDLDDTTQRSTRRRGSVMPVADAESDAAGPPIRRRTGSPLVSDLDDTAPAPRRRRSTAIPAQEDAELPEESTARSTRNAGSALPAGIDESTRIIADEATQLVRPRERVAPPASTTLPSQRRGQGPGASLAPMHALPADAEPPTTPPPPAPPAANPVYGIRPAEPVITERAAPTPRAPQTVIDSAAVIDESRRHGRRRTIIVVATASALAVIAAIALLVVTFTL